MYCQYSQRNGRPREGWLVFIRPSQSGGATNSTTRWSIDNHCQRLGCMIDQRTDATGSLQIGFVFWNSTDCHQAGSAHGPSMVTSAPPPPGNQVWRQLQHMSMREFWYKKHACAYGTTLHPCSSHRLTVLVSPTQQ